MNVRLLSNVAETPTTRRIRLGLNGAAFLYRAGQAASLATSGILTPYSIASAPAETRQHGWLEFLVKVDGSSRFGAVAETLAEGASIDLHGPVGEFTLERASRDAPLLFIAGGTGIAPLRAMVREAVDAGRRDLALVYSNRTPDEFAYLDELTQLASSGCLKLSLTLTGDAQDWAHARGRTGVSHLAELVLPATVAFVCGPPAMVTEVPAALQALGVTPDRVVTESWKLAAGSR